MDQQRFEALFRDCFAQNGLDIYCQGPMVIARFFQFATHLMETNKVMNLTALREMETIIPLHFADCALCMSHIPQGSTVLDIGCGGGFPTIPLAILRPDVTVTGLDSTAKKTVFVAEAAAKLGLDNVQTHAGRAEDWAISPQSGGKREEFDVVISRAVARLPVLSELCLPFVKKGGYFIAMKGAEADIELAEAAKAIRTLGGGASVLHAYTLKVGEAQEKRGVIIATKEKPTPATYPRPYAKIKKDPL